MCTWPSNQCKHNARGETPPVFVVYGGALRLPGTRYRRILPIAFPFASSSTSLSM